MSFFQNSKDVTIRNSTFISQHIKSNKRGFDFLASKALPSAFHMADADVFHAACLPGTRVRTLEQIKSWAYRKAMSDAFILWLHGAAGGGKTAIARSVARWCEDEGILLGEFFFSRADGGRDRIGSLAATIAYRMATLTLPAAKDEISRRVADDPHVFSASLADQFSKLISEPLNLEAPSGIVPHVIILDGLDECLSDIEQDLILSVLSRSLYQLNPGLRILICSRPEPIIFTAFQASHLQQISARISLNDEADSDADILRFLMHEFSTLKQHLLHLPSGEWPKADHLVHLVQKSSGQFIFAATVVKYVCSPRHRHNAVIRLEHVLDLKQLPPNAKHHPFAELDALYSLILSTREFEEVEITTRAIGICLEYPRYFKKIQLENLAEILDFEITRTMAMLDELASLFEITTDGDIRPFHASLVDFLYDRARSRDLFINQEDIITEIISVVLQQGRDPDVLSLAMLVDLLSDVPPNEKVNTTLSRLEPSRIFMKRSFDECGREDGFYLIPALRLLHKHVTAEAGEKYISYFDPRFVSAIEELDSDSMPALQSVSLSSSEDESDLSSDLSSEYDRSNDVPSESDHKDIDLQIEPDSEIGKHSATPEHSSKSRRKSQPQGRASEGSASPPIILTGYGSSAELASLAVLRSWERLRRSLNLQISGGSFGRWEGLRSVCYESQFVRSHLSETVSYFQTGSMQTKGAQFCINKLRYSASKAHRKMFGELLPESLSRAGVSRRLTQSIRALIKRRRNVYDHLPPEAQNAIASYMARSGGKMPDTNATLHLAPTKSIHATSNSGQRPYDVLEKDPSSEKSTTRPSIKQAPSSNVPPKQQTTSPSSQDPGTSSPPAATNPQSPSAASSKPKKSKNKNRKRRRK